MGKGRGIKTLCRLKSLMRVYEGAIIDEELDTILQKDNLRHLFKQLLIDTYL